MLECMRIYTPPVLSSQLLHCRVLPRHITGYGAATWQTFSYPGYLNLGADQLFMSYCQSKNLLGSAGDAWRTVLAQPGQLLLHDNKHMFCLGCWDTVAILWDAVSGSCGKSRAWSFAPFSPSVISFMPILNFAQWEVVDTEWLSPLAITLHNKKKWPDNLEEMGYARQVADPQPFLTLAAKNAYWQVPMTCLQVLARIEYKITLTGNDAEKLLTLIQAALKCSEPQALLYLEMRVAGLSQEEDERHLELLNSSEADDNFTDADQKLASKAVTAMQCKIAQAKLVRNLISKKCGHHKAGPKAGTKAGTKAKFPGSKTKIPDMQNCTVEKLTSFLPPGSSCRMDTFNGRWQVFYRRQGAIKGPWSSCSRSWGCRPHKVCIMQLLRWAWELAASHGVPCPHKGVMKEPAAEVEVDSEMPDA